MPTKSEIIQQFTAKLDAGDVEGSHQYVTEDFQCEMDPKPSALDYDQSLLNKHQHKSMAQKVHKTYRNLKTHIDSISEEGDKVKVKGRTKFSFDYQQPGTTSARTVNEESVYTSVFTFSGDKICALKGTVDTECARKWASSY